MVLVYGFSLCTICGFQEPSHLILNVTSFKLFSMTYGPFQGLGNLEVIPLAMAGWYSKTFCPSLYVGPWTFLLQMAFRRFCFSFNMRRTSSKTR